MTPLLLALLVAFAAGFAAWRVAVARRRSADTRAARENAAQGALLAARQSALATAKAAPAPQASPAAADADAARASARAKAQRVIAAEAARRQAAIQKAQNVARVEAERRAAEAAKTSADLASTLPSPHLPTVERTTPLFPKPPAAAAPALGEKTTPLVRPAPAAARKPAPAKVLKTAAQTVVMLVDDSKMVRVKSSRLLASHGFQVVTAIDGVDALRQLESCCPDLVITDVDMPGMDGFGLVNALRADPRTRHIPLVMITSAEDRHREEALRVGVGLVMGKPYDEPALIAHILGFQFFAKAEESEALACA